MAQRKQGRRKSLNARRETLAGTLMLLVLIGNAPLRAQSRNDGGQLLSSRTIDEIRNADQFCSTPGIYDDSCIENAVRDLDGGGAPFSGSGRVYLGTHGYTLHHPVILHRNVALSGDARHSSFLIGDGIFDFSMTGMIRFCQLPDCSGTPPTHGESDVTLEALDVRIARSADVGINGYGLTDSHIENVIVDSLSSNPAEGLGTAMILSSDAGVSAFRNSIIDFVSRYTAVGVKLGTPGPANANVFIGGSLMGQPAVEISSGVANLFEGTTFNGTNRSGDTLAKLDSGADHNQFMGNYFDDGLGLSATCRAQPCNGVALSIASGAQGNAIFGAHFDGEGGTMAGVADDGSDTEFFALGPIASAVESNNDRVFAGGGRNVFFSARTGPKSRYGFGNGTLTPSSAYGFAVSGRAPLSDGMELLNTASPNESNALFSDWYFNNSAGQKTLFGALKATSGSIAPGSEVVTVELQCRAAGVLVDCLRFVGSEGYLNGTLSPAVAAKASLGTPALPFGSLCIGSGAQQAACINGSFTGSRAVHVPDAPSSVAQGYAPEAHQFLTGFDAGTGTFSSTRPSASDLVNGAYSGRGTIYPDEVVLNSAMPLRAVVSAGGSTIPAFSCIDRPADVAGVTTAMTAALSPAGAPDESWSSIQWSAYVSSTGRAQIRLCNVAASTATPAVTTFNLRILQ